MSIHPVHRKTNTSSLPHLLLPVLNIHSLREHRAHRGGGGHREAATGEVVSVERGGFRVERGERSVEGGRNHALGNVICGVVKDECWTLAAKRENVPNQRGVHRLDTKDNVGYWFIVIIKIFKHFTFQSVARMDFFVGTPKDVTAPKKDVRFLGQVHLA